MTDRVLLRRRTAGRLWQTVMRVMFIMLFGLVLLVILGRILPVPSTLMLARWIIGQPVTRTWVPLGAISPNLPQAVIAVEDQRFCRHWGVDFGALREVLADEDGPSRGGSTITMQTVKNVYLWPGQSYVRKAIEIPLALVVDLIWGKQRVMEVYLNIAEWGDGLYGAEAASRFYFRKSAATLTEVEAARLVSALPNPFLRAPTGASQYSRRVFSRMDGIGELTACIRQSSNLP
jgi:monofunctional glycosyltransferase